MLDGDGSDFTLAGSSYPSNHNTSGKNSKNNKETLSPLTNDIFTSDLTSSSTEDHRNRHSTEQDFESRSSSDFESRSTQDYEGSSTKDFDGRPKQDFSGRSDRPVAGLFDRMNVGRMSESIDHTERGRDEKGKEDHSRRRSGTINISGGPLSYRYQVITEYDHMLNHGLKVLIVYLLVCSELLTDRDQTLNLAQFGHWVRS